MDKECPECEKDRQYNPPKDLGEIKRRLKKGGYEIKKVS